MTDTSTKTTTAKTAAKPAVSASAKTTAATKPVAKVTKMSDKTTAATKPVAKAKPTTTVKATTAKKPVVKPAKKERKSRKGITRSFAAEVTASVSPVMASVNEFITNPTTSEDALKMIRLELRKSVRATRSTINSRKSVKA